MLHFVLQRITSKGWGVAYLYKSFELIKYAKVHSKINQQTP